jgi:hypothetical protein
MCVTLGSPFTRFILRYKSQIHNKRLKMFFSQDSTNYYSGAPGLIVLGVRK